MAFETNRPIAMYLRTGTLNDPFHFIEETDRKVSDRGIIVLQEIPINQQGFVLADGTVSQEDPTNIMVSIESGGSTIVFDQIVDPSADLQEFQYRLDSVFGILSFDIESHAGLENVNISYVGKGAFFISASRIYSDSDFTQDGGVIPETLQKVLDDLREISVNSTTTGAPGTEASVTVDGNSFDFVIPRGQPFTISAEYASVADLSSETPSVIPEGYEPELFDLVIINTASVEDEENARLYIYDEEGPDGGFTFISDLSGATGPVRGLQ